MNGQYYRDLIDHIMTDSHIDARTTYFFMLTIQEMIEKDFTISSNDFRFLKYQTGELAKMIKEYNPDMQTIIMPEVDK